eukprot:COSAG02_NODE_53405_length_302_cov_0.733990_1_plen_38_part_01
MHGLYTSRAIAGSGRVELHSRWVRLCLYSPTATTRTTR